MRDKIFYSILTGIYFGSTILNYIDTKIWSLFLVLGIFFLFYKRYTYSLVLIFICLILIRGQTIFIETKIPIDTKVKIISEISSEPDIREISSKLVLDVKEIRLENKIIYTEEKSLITIPLYPSYEIGDLLSVEGTFTQPKNFQNDNGIEFDYQSYLSKDNIYSISYYPKITKLEDSKRLTRFVFDIKNKFLESIQRIIPSPESELLGGILLGTKRSLGKELEDKFRIVGLIHIVVLSGYNITIIADAIFRFFGFLPKTFSAILGTISIIIFSTMVGSGATIIRATIMTLIAILSRVFKRTYNVNRSLFLAAGIMLIHNPFILVHDPSFQLSFLATIGLINLSPLVKKILFFIPEKFELREISTATLATQITVLPLLIKMTGELSLVAPIVNILTLQIIPITMLLGFISGLVGFFNQTIGLVMSIAPYLFLKYILLIVNIFSSFNFSTITI